MLYYDIVISFAGLYTKRSDGKLFPLKADHDVLNLKDNDIVLVEIKD